MLGSMARGLMGMPAEWAAVSSSKKYPDTRIALSKHRAGLDARKQRGTRAHTYSGVQYWSPERILYAVLSRALF